MTSAWVLLVTPTPTPGPSSPVVTGPDPDRVTPGVAGFLVMFLLALATILLLRSMTRHLRKVRYSPDPAADGAGTPAEPTEPTESTESAEPAGAAAPEKPEKAANGTGPTP